MATLSSSTVSEKDGRHDRLKRQVDATLEQLAEQLNAGQSAEYLEVLRFYRRFWRYSPFNQLLIAWQKPDARAVASYRKWQELGRQVRQGASAAWIFVPMFRKRLNEETGEKEQVLCGFREGPVFADTDLVDIEANPLPTIWKPLPDDMQPLLGSFIEKLGEIDITVRFETLPASVGGYANHHTKVIGLAKGLDSRNSLATLVHECAHLMLHSDPDTRPDLQIRELEAESVSFVMSEILGLEYSVSADYLIGYRVTPDQVKTALDRIQRTVKQLVELLDIAL